MRYLFIITLFLLFNTLGYGQDQEMALLQNLSAHEDLSFILSNKTALVGETLQYQIYCFKNKKTKSTYSDLSKVAHIMLINSDREILLKQKINLNSGIGTGSFFIPSSYKNGHYKLIAYTNIMLNQSKQFSSKDLVILNPYSTISKKITSKRESAKNFEKKSGEIISSSQISIKTNAEIFNKREGVTLTITGENLNPHNRYILKVEKKDSLDQIAEQFNSKLSHVKINPDDRLFLPELRGPILHGRVKSKSSRNTKNYIQELITLSIPGNNSFFKVIRPNNNGEFFIELPDEERLSDSKIHLQFLKNKGVKQYNTQIKLDSFQPHLKNLHIASSVVLPSYFEQSILDRSKSIQVENAYINIKSDSLAKKTPQPFYTPLQKSFVLDEYKRFSTIKKTLIEIIPRIHFIKKNGVYRLELNDYVTNDLESFYGNTLVLVDGALLKNLEKFMDYDPKKISQIDIVNRGYVYGPYIFNGIINFITKDKNYEYSLGKMGLVKNISHPLPESKSYQPDYEHKNLERIPDYRYTLLWKPNLKLSSDKKRIKFFTSDITGVFEITIKGYDQDGNKILKKKKIQVK